MNHSTITKSSGEQNRIFFIDIFRGIGIILMIMGHIYFGVRFDKFIHAFHMPMFFFCVWVIFSY
jgi:fucose 4-O-acetylase-like acetyltransferase